MAKRKKPSSKAATSTATDAPAAPTGGIDNDPLFQALFDKSPIPAAVTGLGGDKPYLRVNAAYCDFVGYTADELLGMSLFDVSHPDERTQMQKHEALLVAGDITRVLREKRYLRKDGATIWGGLCYTAIHDHEGAPLYALSQVRDLTEQRVAQSRLLSAIESLPHSIALFDKEDRLVICNARYRDRKGMGEDAFTPGRKFEHIVRDIVDAGLIDLFGKGVEEAVRDRMRQHRSLEPVDIYKTSDGHWIQTTEHRTSDGGTILVRVDVSEQKHQEQALRKSEERFRDFTETATDWIWETDPDHRLAFLSGSLSQPVEMDRNNAIGKTRAEFYGSDATARDSADWHRHQADLDTRRPFQDFSYAFDHDGKRRHLKISGRPYFDEDGEFLGYRGTGRDVTEETLAIQRLHDLSAAFEAMSEPVAVFDANDRFIFANAAFRSLNEPVLDEIALGKPFEGYIRALAWAGINAQAVGREAEWIDWRLALHRKPSGPFELERRDGRWYLAFEQRLPSGGQLLLLTDISSLKATQRELEIARDEAETANNAKSEFLSSMSHELRTPLNSILGFGQLLEDGPNVTLSAQQRKCVDHIVRAGNLLLQLVDEVLELSRIESGMLNLKPEPLMPANIFRECMEMVRPMAEQRSITMAGKREDNNGIVVDPARLKQILLNLMSNAVKYNTAGGRVDFGCRRTDDGRVRIYVSDTGTGIPEDRQANLFQPFNRAGRENSDIQGTGIGLTISQRLAEAMGGTMGFESRPDEGSTFWVDFPEHDGPPPPSDGNIPSLTATSHAEDGDARGLVLYIEDNPANIELMAQVLERCEGVEMISAHNAEFGLVMAAEYRPDLILMDINLPGMDGLEARHALRANDQTASIPVVAVSANAMPSDREQGTENGFEDYITKPFNIETLIATVERILRARRR